MAECLSCLNSLQVINTALARLLHILLMTIIILSVLIHKYHTTGHNWIHDLAQLRQVLQANIADIGLVVPLSLGQSCTG